MDTTILVKNTTRDRLKEKGRKGQTYDQLINLLLEKAIFDDTEKSD